MSSPNKAVPFYTHTGRHITPLEQAFISSYVICKNAAQAVVEAGYKSKAPSQYIEQ